MLYCDTNALIALPLWARADHPAVTRVADGEPAAVCSVVWYEFLIGPIDQSEIDLAQAFLRGQITAVDEEYAALAAVLFNAAGRRRKLKTYALIAASAMRADATFVTVNANDFEPFVARGLKLMDVRL